MGNKPVTAVPGIDNRVGRSLTAQGIVSARNLYGHFLIDSEEFRRLIERHGASAKSQQEVYNTMESYEALHDH